MRCALTPQVVFPGSTQSLLPFKNGSSLYVLETLSCCPRHSAPAPATPTPTPHGVNKEEWPRRRLIAAPSVPRIAAAIPVEVAASDDNNPAAVASSTAPGSISEIASRISVRASPSVVSPVSQPWMTRWWL